MASSKGYKEGLKKAAHFGNPEYQETRPDLREVFDAQFEQCAEVPMKAGEDDPGRGYIPDYAGSERKNAARPWNKVRPKAEGL